MISKPITYLTGIALFFAVFFCLAVQESFAMSTTPGIYHFFGRVMNQEDKPVGSCSLVLIKQVASEDKQKAGDPEQKEKQYTVSSEEQVATTDEDGNFAFSFEVLTAENFWVVFSAEGYRTRSVELNGLMRSRFFTKPNKSPIKLDVVLEKSEK